MERRAAPLRGVAATGPRSVRASRVRSAAVDAFLAVASKREVRDYDDRPLPDAVVTRILEVGRVAGSSMNRQQRRFLVLEDADLREQLAEMVYVPSNVRGAALVVAIVVHGRGPTGFDAGRSAQNMMLAAWNEGIVSCPNGMPDAERAAAALGLAGDERPVLVLSFGYPATPRDPERRSAEEWSERANRRPLGELVDWR